MLRHIDSSAQSQKNKINQVSKAISQLQAFTNNLQYKVDGILKAKEAQFVDSYKSHMAKIKQQFDELAVELKKREQKIKQYQNQGKMAYLIKRVDFLETQQKKLLNDLQKKKADIRNAILENNILKSQNKRLQQKIKQLLKTKASLQQKSQRDHNASYESIPTFATEIGQDNLKKALSKMRTQQKSLNMRSINQKSQSSINPQLAPDINRFERQISVLKKQNRQLISFNSKFVSQTTTMEKFFVEVVNQIKKNIISRKQIKQCTLDDFRKEDKLQLMIKILSNDEITYHLHSIIFGNQTRPPILQKIQKSRPSSFRDKFNPKRSVQYHFPTLKSSRLY